MPEFSPCVGSFSLVLWQRLSKFPFQPCFEESDSTGIWTVVYLQLKTSNSHLKASFMEWDLYVLQSSSIVMKPKGYKFTIYFRKRKDKQMAIKEKEKKKKKTKFSGQRTEGENWSQLSSKRENEDIELAKVMEHAHAIYAPECKNLSHLVTCRRNLHLVGVSTAVPQAIQEVRSRWACHSYFSLYILLGKHYKYAREAAGTCQISISTPCCRLRKKKPFTAQHIWKVWYTEQTPPDVSIGDVIYKWTKQLVRLIAPGGI